MNEAGFHPLRGEGTVNRFLRMQEGNDVVVPCGKLLLSSGASIVVLVSSWQEVLLNGSNSNIKTEG